MKDRLTNDNNNKKVKLTKEQQLWMLEFFVKTSIPRMLQSSKEEK